MRALTSQPRWQFASIHSLLTDSVIRLDSIVLTVRSFFFCVYSYCNAISVKMQCFVKKDGAENPSRRDFLVIFFILSSVLCVSLFHEAIKSVSKVEHQHNKQSACHNKERPMPERREFIEWHYRNSENNGCDSDTPADNDRGNKPLE